MATIYGAFRTADTTLTSLAARTAQIGATFEISAYSTITIDDGNNSSLVEGDGNQNEDPDDSTQTYDDGNGPRPFFFDYSVTVEDTNSGLQYKIGIFDYDLDSSGGSNQPTEHGYFIGFLDGSVPPLNTTLEIIEIGDGAFADPNVNLDTSRLVPCFTRGTRISTVNGEQFVEGLKSGDRIVTYSGINNTPASERIVRVFHRTLTADELNRNPKLRPVRILAGSLGEGLPKQDLLVSRQHRMLMRSKICERIFGKKEVLVPAIKLTEIPGIFVDEDVSSVEYFHLLFEKHEIIYAEGAPTESLFTGQEALKAVPPEVRKEIFTIFPELADINYTPEPARFIPTGKQQKHLIQRHLKNNKPLLLWR